MNILAVDDEQPMLRILKSAIHEAVPDCSLAGFTTGTQALEYASISQIDVAFLDIKMPGIGGLELAKRLKELYGQTNIVFVTGYSDYAPDAWKLHVSGYILKPATAEDILRELEYLRHPVVLPDKGVRVQCFGGFGVFIDGKPLMFAQAKPKELLALLVHKQGAPVSNAEIAAVLWEDRPYDKSTQSQVRNVISFLTKALKQAGIGDLLIRARNRTAIDTTRFSCDFYSFQRGHSLTVNNYAGTYMDEYSWAEFTAARLDNITK